MNKPGVKSGGVYGFGDDAGGFCLNHPHMEEAIAPIRDGTAYSNQTSVGRSLGTSRLKGRPHSARYDSSTVLKALFAAPT